MKSKKRMPVNMSMEEEAKFWEKNDLSQYIDDTYEEEVHLNNDLKNEIIRRHFDSKGKVSITKTPVPSFVFQVTKSSSQGMFGCEPDCNSADNQDIEYKETYNILVNV